MREDQVASTRLPFLIPTLLFTSLGARLGGAPTAVKLSKAYIDDASRVHLVYSDGRQIQPPREKGQAGCESLKIADDGQTVGWLVDFDNAGLTYPIALSLVVFRDGKVPQHFGDLDVDVIEDWQFHAGGKQVAFVTNAFHGGGRAHYELRDVEKGTLLAKWDGPLNQRSPDWTRGLWDEDAE